MKHWAVVFRNFGQPRLIRRTFTRRGAEKAIEHWQTHAPIGAKIPSQRLYVAPAGELVQSGASR